MTKSNSLFREGAKSTATILPSFILINAAFYAVASYETQEFPYIPTEDEIATTYGLGAWILGVIALIWIFLVVKKVLKRKNFDLETLNQENHKYPLWLWAAKEVVGNIIIVVILFGGLLAIIPTGLVAEGDFLLQQGRLAAMVIAIVTGWSTLNIAGEAIRRQWRKIRAR